MAQAPLVGVIMGSQSDWDTMQHASAMLALLDVPHECRVVSAHRTPDLLFDYASSAHGRGLRVIIAGAGGAAHLPGMCASKTHLPVLGVPVESKALRGLDSLLSIAQMPAGIPVGTLAIGRAGATNAGMLAAAILSHTETSVRTRLERYRTEQTASVLAHPIPRSGHVAPAIDLALAQPLLEWRGTEATAGAGARRSRTPRSSDRAARTAKGARTGGSTTKRAKRNGRGKGGR
jgi:5-(carboxyamino)imidazole ribonucleotide mutase